MEYTPSDSLVVYSFKINLEIGIHVERAPVTTDTTEHLDRARGLFDDVWAALGAMKSGAFPIVRIDAEREQTDDASAVDYIIRAYLDTKQKETNC
jgi:hypothetical protein